MNIRILRSWMNNYEKKEINLIPKEHRQIHLKLNKVVVISAISAVLAAVLLIAYILPQNRITKLYSDISALQKEIGILNKESENYGLYEKRINDLNKRKNVLNVIETEKVKIIDSLNKLSSNLPENVYIQSLSINKDKTFDISFVINTPLDGAKLVDRLNESNMFNEIESISIPVKSGRNVIKLNLKLKE